MRSVRILVVDDYDDWRRLICSILATRPDFEVIGEAVNGQDAVQKAHALQPDLILLDIGLPILNGIEAAQRIREVSRESRVLVISETCLAEIAEEAFRSGVAGYVVKSGAGSELLNAVEAVLRGKRFISALLSGSAQESVDEGTSDATAASCLPTHLHRNETAVQRHEVEFYRDDAALISDFARRTADGLRNGNGVFLIVTESHRAAIYSALRADGLDIERAVERGDLYPMDAYEAIGMIMGDELPDVFLLAQLSHQAMTQASRDENGAERRVSICAECAPTLLGEGNHDAAIRLEHLWDDVTKRYDVDSVCGYVRSALPSGDLRGIVEKICAEHSAIHGRDLVC